MSTPVDDLIDEYGLDPINENIRAALDKAMRGHGACQRKWWCVLKEGHDGPCIDTTTKRVQDSREMLQNYRGRRYEVCVAIDKVEDVIENLGVDDGSVLPPCGHGLPPAPSRQVVEELKNTARNLLRLVLLFNDGEVSSSKLNGF